MAIYIKGMKMPKDCDLCPFQKYDGYEIQPFWYCLLTGLKIDHSLVPSGNNCPLVYIPEPHGRLIDERVAYDKIAEQETGYYMDMDGVDRGLQDTPTVIEGSE